MTRGRGISGVFQHKLKSLPWPLLLVFLLLTVGISTSGYIFYNKQKKDIYREQTANLRAVADLKANEISRWLNERLGDAGLIAENRILTAELLTFLRDRSAGPRQESIRGWMESLRNNYHYQNVLLLDWSGEVVLALTRPYPVIDSAGLDLMEAVRRRKGAIISDLQRSANMAHPHLDVVAPLLAADMLDGFVFLCIDPAEFLYPMIQSWPTPSPSAETLLVRREGDEVVYLNELRHRKNTALNLRFPLTATGLPATQVVLGKQGVVAGTDYRGVPILAAVRPVVSSSWFIVAKIDQEEVERPLRRSALAIFLVTMSLALAAALLILFLWQRQNTSFRLRQLETESQKQALVQHFDYLTRYANDSILLSDEEGNILEANERAVLTYGYGQEALLKMNLRDLRGPGEQDKLAGQMRQAEEWQGLLFETTHQKKDGAAFPVEVSARVIAVDDKKYFQSIIRDISERKRVEEALRNSENKFSKAFRASPDVLVISRLADGLIIEANDSWDHLFGYSREEVIGRNSFEMGLFANPADRQNLAAQLQEQNFVHDFEAEIKRKSGEVRQVTLSVETIEIDSEPYILTIIHDITEHKQAEEALRESERKFRETIVNLDEGYYSTTLDGKLLEHNQAFNRILGYDIAQDLRGANLPDFWQDPDKRMEYLKAFAATSSVTNYQIDAKTKTGEKITMLFSAHLVRDENNQPQRIEGVFLDISERIRIETEIRRLNKELEQRVLQRTAQLEAANKELEAFSYSVSHDLRAPLRAIDGFARIVLEEYTPKLDDEGRRLLDVIAANTHKMGQLIDDLLAFSHLSRQQTAFAPVDLAALAAAVFTELKSMEKGRRIEFKIGALPAAFGDRSLLRLVLQNLLANAIKFTRPRTRARIELAGQAGKGENIYQVKDNGVGFDMEYVHKLFGVFQRLHNSDEFEGTGVGLAIVQRIVLRHGGHVWAESAAKGGATFYFSLPSKEGIGSRVEGIVSEPLQGYKEL